MEKHVIGYARVSTTDQNLEMQKQALRAAGCNVIRSEKRSGTTTAGRDALHDVLGFLRSGDVLMVTRIDRLARSIWRPARHCPRCEGPRRVPKGYRAVNRHRHGCGQMLPRHVVRVRRIRDQSAP